MNKLLVISGVGFTILASAKIWQEGFTFVNLGMMAFCLLMTIFFVFHKRIDASLDHKRKNRANKRNCIIDNDHFFFPTGYYFKHGFLKNKNKLAFSCIDEFRVNTVPISAKINGNELIFLIGIKEEDLPALAQKENIPIKSPQDNWSLLCENFLDTDSTKEEKASTIELLVNGGISEKEISSIRKRLSFRMLLRPYFSWEWIYYGQYDVLIELFPLNKYKYYWTMDVALRTANK